ncbi:GNAT family N-acetyltransferase [Agromyces sp. Soil535]|uniref:GNAT family N-acetyltransferase n=1 Tax=Agromyces sp. Soil535 TaxID=1736390 RepID=UPI0009E911AD|nr:GNAT family N-acetyltransferase [Agromyces sp. Soil535]
MAAELDSPAKVRIEVLSRRDSHGRVGANDLLRRYHGTIAAIPSVEDEAAQRAIVPALPGTETVVALVDGQLVGVATAWVRIGGLDQLATALGWDRAVEWLTRWRVFTHIAVTEEHRGYGVGRRLVGRLEGRCIRSGAAGLWGFAEELPAPSAPFYETLGYVVAKRGDGLVLDGVPVAQPPRTRVGQLFMRQF